MKAAALIIIVVLIATGCAVSLYSSVKCHGDCEVIFDRDSVPMMDKASAPIKFHK